MAERRRKERQGGLAPRVMVSVPMHPHVEQRIKRASKAAGESRAEFIREAATARANTFLGPDPKRAA